MFIKGDVVKYNKYYKNDDKYGEVIFVKNYELTVKFTYPISERVQINLVSGNESMFCLVYRPFDILHELVSVIIYFAGMGVLIGSVVSLILQREPPFWVIILFGLSGAFIISFFEIYQKVKKKMEYLNNQGG